MTMKRSAAHTARIASASARTVVRNLEYHCWREERISGFGLGWVRPNDDCSYAECSCLGAPKAKIVTIAAAAKLKSGVAIANSRDSSRGPRSLLAAYRNSVKNYAVGTLARSFYYAVGADSVKLP